MKSTSKIKLRNYKLQRQERRIEVMTDEQINMIKELLRKKLKKIFLRMFMNNYLEQ